MMNILPYLGQNLHVITENQIDRTFSDMGQFQGPAEICYLLDGLPQLGAKELVQIADYFRKVDNVPADQKGRLLHYANVMYRKSINQTKDLSTLNKLHESLKESASFVREHAGRITRLHNILLHSIAYQGMSTSNTLSLNARRSIEEEGENMPYSNLDTLQKDLLCYSGDAINFHDHFMQAGKTLGDQRDEALETLGIAAYNLQNFELAQMVLKEMKNRPEHTLTGLDYMLEGVPPQKGY